MRFRGWFDGSRRKNGEALKVQIATLATSLEDCAAAHTSASGGATDEPRTSSETNKSHDAASDPAAVIVATVAEPVPSRIPTATQAHLGPAVPARVADPSVGTITEGLQKADVRAAVRDHQHAGWRTLGNSVGWSLFALVVVEVIDNQAGTERIRLSDDVNGAAANWHWNLDINDQVAAGVVGGVVALVAALVIASSTSQPPPQTASAFEVVGWSRWLEALSRIGVAASGIGLVVALTQFGAGLGPGLVLTVVAALGIWLASAAVRRADTRLHDLDTALRAVWRDKIELSLNRIEDKYPTVTRWSTTTTAASFVTLFIGPGFITALFSALRKSGAGARDLDLTTTIMDIVIATLSLSFVGIFPLVAILFTWIAWAENRSRLSWTMGAVAAAVVLFILASINSNFGSIPPLLVLFDLLLFAPHLFAWLRGRGPGLAMLALSYSGRQDLLRSKIRVEG